jgi:octaprenyl-diphosphate synthase
MQTTHADHGQKLSEIRNPVANDLLAVDQLIATALVSNVPLIQRIVGHIINSGGKRLRPLIVLLTASACGYVGDNEHHELAAIIEFIHTATLLHDDVIDKSELRRGQQTANAIWGNQTSVLVGDFLYSRAFQVLARRSNIPVMKVLANTTNQIAEGEVWQLMNRHEPDIDESIYREVIRRKTAQLFSAATEIAAIISTKDLALQQTLANFGMELGMAYQIIDDLLDYTASAEQMGKNIGDDLAEGKATLPLIYAKQQASAKDAARIRQAIQQGGLEGLTDILEIIASTRAYDYTLQCARKHAAVAKELLLQLPTSAAREALAQLTDFIVERDY